MDENEVLSIPLFAGLSKKERQTIAQHADVLDFEQGRYLVREGEFPYEFFVTVEGTAEVVHDGEHVADLKSGDFFGELALMGGVRRNASVVATSPIKVVVMTAKHFRQMKRELPDVCRRISATVEERGRAIEASA